MANFREVNEEDILKEWLEYREETLLCQLSDEDYKHSLNFNWQNTATSTLKAYESILI